MGKKRANYCRINDEPGGCTRSDCRFFHPGRTTNPETPLQSTSNTNHKPDNRNKSSGFRAKDTRMVPNGLCRSFYYDGKCDKGFDCKFSHTQSTSTSSAKGKENERSFKSSDSSTPTSTPDYGQLASNVNTSSALLLRGVTEKDRDGEFKKLLQLIIERDFRLNESSHVYIFVKGLLSTTLESTVWDFQETQLLLARVAAVPGSPISRIRDILCWGNVSSSAGNRSDVLSFQRAFVPLFLYLSSKAVRNSTSDHHVNSFYLVLHNNSSSWATSTSKCVKELIHAKTVVEESVRGSRTSFQPTTFLQLFKSIGQVLIEYLSRFKTALVENPSIVQLLADLKTAFTTFALDIVSPCPTFKDDLNDPAVTEKNRKFVLHETGGMFEILDNLTERVQGRLVTRAAPTLDFLSKPQLGVLTALKSAYDPPGELRTTGPRFDNDRVSIKDITILPSHAELLSAFAPFLPANIPSSPHHLIAGTMERQLDIIFRLLREDTFGPVRSAVKSLLYDLGTGAGSRKQDIMNFLHKGGGRWRSQDNSNSVDLNLYGAVNFQNLSILNHALVVTLSFLVPKNFNKNPAAKSQKLQKGSVVGLLLHKVDARVSEESKVFLGSVEADVEAGRGNFTQVKITLHDPEVYTNAIQHLEQRRSSDKEISKMIFFEVPNLILPTVQPFLSRLQVVEPSSIPFAKYIAASTDANFTCPAIEPALYARNPHFTFDLSGLLPGEEELKLDANNVDSIDYAKDALKRNSGLDASQVDALVESLSRELAMIEGPPGTGKSYVGVKLVETLLKNKVGPILVICYTNHALDQFLENILDGGATSSIIRCGSRSKSERIQALSLYEVTKSSENAKRVGLRREMYAEFKTRETIEAELETICGVASSYSSTNMRFKDLSEYLKREHHYIYQALQGSPPSLLVETYYQENEDGEWQTVNLKHNRKERHPPNEAPFTWWQNSYDLDLYSTVVKNRQDAKAVLTKQAKIPASKQESYRNPYALPDQQVDIQDSFEGAEWEGFTLLDEESDTSDDSSSDEEIDVLSDKWIEPQTNRSIHELLDSEDPWNFSREERKLCLRYWAEDIIANEVPALVLLRAKLAEACARISSLQDQSNLAALQGAQIIGCTTTGAAKILPLLSSALPRVLIVEEAGECLESHVVVNLVPSIQHTILIGDHLQLRPQIACYGLSVESQAGKLYRLDESLFERLVNAKLPFSMLETQRRMRPGISDLIRKFLYPNLVDHQTVLKYPSIRGMSKDIAFFDHHQREDRQEQESSSRTNTYEAKMIVDLVEHLLKQGYKPGDIAILTAYLGQLKVVRSLLSKVNLYVEIHERDLEKLARAGDDSEEETDVNLAPPKLELMSANSAVTLRSVDNFQGEEAKIVLLSLVRNAGNESDNSDTSRNIGPSSIGFLRSPNRANVALSRAKEGMYIFGDAKSLKSGSPMWNSVISTLEERDNVVTDGLPIRCDKHPDHHFIAVNQPGLLSQISPQGGCLRQCSFPMKCGHFCKLLCHPVDSEHLNTNCPEDCSRVLECSHPCQSRCGTKCPSCSVPIAKVELPCGHTAQNVVCSKAQRPEQIVCQVKSSTKLPCGHETLLRCGVEPSKIICKEICRGKLDCSHSICRGKCSDCISLNKDGLTSNHVDHACGNQLIATCSHLCEGSCKEHRKNEDCGLCTRVCENSCAHRSCSHECGSAGCVACLSQCSWKCEHGACENTCSMPCSRLPCDFPCQQRLKCGHNCPSICGEPCDRQICIICATSDVKSSIVDFLMQRTLGELDLVSPDLSERTITLRCRHSFTVETLDGTFGLDKFYSQDNEGKWNGLLVHNSETVTPLVCPTCRVQLQSRDVNRYGRILKHISLRIQQQSASARGSRILSNLSKEVEKVDAKSISDIFEAKPGLLSQSGLKKPKTPDVEVQRLHQYHLNNPWAIVTPLEPYANLVPHGISHAIAKIWKEGIRLLIKPFMMAMEVAQCISPYQASYNSAFSGLFKSEMDRLASIGSDLNQSQPFELAMEFAKDTIGVAKPLAELRTSIEGLHVSLDLRSTLLELVTTLASMVKRIGGEDALNQFYRINYFALFISSTCIRDSRSAVNITRSQLSLQLSVRTAVYLADWRYEETRLYVEKELHDADQQRRTINIESVCSKMAKSRDHINAELNFSIEIYRNSAKGNIETFSAIEAFLEERCLPTLNLLDMKWKSLEKKVRQDPFYQPVSEEEKKAVLNILKGDVGGNLRGHSYACPNGHTFLIGECGMAMELSRCPECNCPVGGRSHTLTEGNTRATELEELVYGDR